MFEKLKERVKEAIEYAKTAEFIDTKNALDIHRKKHADRVLEVLVTKFQKYYLSHDEIERFMNFTKKQSKRSFIVLGIFSFAWLSILLFTMLTFFSSTFLKSFSFFFVVFVF